MKLKRLAALFLSLVMVCALALPAGAAGVTNASTGKITVTNVEANAADPTALHVSVDAYRIIETTFEEATGNVFHAFAGPVQTWLGNQTNGLENIKVVSDLAGAADTVKTLFYKALGSAIATGDTGLAGLSKTSLTVDPNVPTTYSASNMAMGQYLVLVSGTGEWIYAPISVDLVPTYDEASKTWSLNDGTKEAAVNVKKTKLSVDKTVTGESNTPSPEDVAAQAAPINFTISAQIPFNPKDITKSLVINDYMTAGLTYVAGSLKAYAMPAGVTDVTDPTVKTLTAADNWTPVADGPHTGKNALALSFPYTDIEGFDKVVVTYSATLNQGAVVVNPNTNDVTLSWGNDYTTTITTAKVYTYGLRIDKFDSETAAKLPGAVFKLEKLTGADKTDPAAWTEIAANADNGGTSIPGDPNGGYQFISSDPEGKIEVKGLGEGTYRFTETVAPNGYNLLTNPVEFTLTAVKDSTSKLNGLLTVDHNGQADADGFYDVSVGNSRSVVLPGTGGIGTTLFTAGGVILMLSAGAFLFLNRKKVFGV